MKKPSRSSGSFRFTRHATVGAAAAEDDDHFLASCFEDNGDIAVLLNCSDPRRIVLGRTGAGKSALLMQLRKHSDHVIPLRPEDLSLNFLANSTILPYLTSLGVNIDPFYKLLWRHVFAITLIQHRVSSLSATHATSLIAQLHALLESKESRSKRQHAAAQHKKALEYLDNWGDKFFEGTEIRTKVDSATLRL